MPADELAAIEDCIAFYWQKAQRAAESGHPHAAEKWRMKAAPLNKLLNEAKQEAQMEFHDCNKEMSPEELNKMIAETIWMADRPRTWWEWFCYTFWPRS
jgi:hypothetical protein